MIDTLILETDDNIERKIYISSNYTHFQLSTNYKLK